MRLIFADEVAKQIRELPNPDQFVNNAIQEALKKLRLETINQRVAGLGTAIKLRNLRHSHASENLDC